MEPLVLSTCIGHTRHADLTIVMMSTHMQALILCTCIGCTRHADLTSIGMLFCPLWNLVNWDVSLPFGTW